MREILFRGKREDNQWEYGNYYIAEKLDKSGVEYFIIDIDAEGSQHYVIPETVGQYTGLTDKKGKKIFEGDIAKFRRFENNYIGKIVFNYKTAGFEFWWNVIVGAYGEKARHTANLSVCDEIEVIGNIHDNLDLLKGE